MMKRPNVRLWGAAVLLVAVCAGCNAAASSDRTSASPPPSTPRFGQIPTDANVQVLPGQQNDNDKNVETTVSPETPPPVEPAQPPAALTFADKKVQTSSNSKPENKKADSADPEAYDAKKPSLMGIRLGDTKQTVKQKYEDPTSEYEMDDDKDPLSVIEYDGFTVGFNKAGTVEFIEITSKDVNPGLNGLRLGQKVKDAETALGKPDTNTNYALHYKSAGAVLKLDIDPKSEAIQSIKLFPGQA